VTIPFGPLALDPVLPPLLLAAVTVPLAAFATAIAARRRGSARIRWVLRLGMVLLVTAAALRPVVPGDASGPTATGGLEVYLAVDTTSSMAAEDAPPSPGPASEPPRTRLDQAKDDVAAIVAALPSAQFSLTTFDSTAVQRVPLTADAGALLAQTEAITQEVTVYSSGSSIDEPLESLAALLGDAREEHPDRRRVLFYLGDGEQTRDRPPASFGELAPYLSGGGVLGYGTEEGGRMRVYQGLADRPLGSGGQDDDAGPPTYILDPAGTGPALSRIDRTALAALSEQLGVPFRERVATDAGDLTDGIEVGDVDLRPGSITGPVELYALFAAPLGLLALREAIAAGLLVAGARPARRDRRARA